MWIVAYMGPGPPADTGLHRYQWVLYEQNVSTDDMELRPGAIRGGWDVDEFLAANNMMDDLVASFQFRAQNEG